MMSGWRLFRPKELIDVRSALQETLKVKTTGSITDSSTDIHFSVGTSAAKLVERVIHERTVLRRPQTISSATRFAALR